MTWTCNLCATRHETAEEIAQCESSLRWLKIYTGLILLAVIAVVLVLEIAWCQYAYGDWECAFMECRKVVP